MLVSLALPTPYLTSWPCKACRAARREAGPEPPRPQPRLAAPLYAITLSLSLSGRERERETRRSSPPPQAAASPLAPSRLWAETGPAWSDPQEGRDEEH